MSFRCEHVESINAIKMRDDKNSSPRSLSFNFDIARRRIRNISSEFYRQFYGTLHQRCNFKTCQEIIYRIATSYFASTLARGNGRKSATKLDGISGSGTLLSSATINSVCRILLIAFRGSNRRYIPKREGGRERQNGKTNARIVRFSRNDT